MINIEFFQSENDFGHLILDLALHLRSVELQLL
jgi:hypothetical protein